MTVTITNSTKWIEATTGDYPLSESDIKRRYPNTSFPNPLTQEALTFFDFFAVQPTAPPTGDVPSELAPRLNEAGIWEEVWETRSFNTEELAARLASERITRLAELNAVRGTALETGVPIDFGVPYGVMHIQLRDRDRINILGLRVKAEAMIAAADPSTIPIRMYENASVPLTAQQIMTLSWKVLGGYEEIMYNTWHLQDLVNAAETIGEVPIVPITLIPAVSTLDPA